MRRFAMAVAGLCSVLLSGCGYNQLQTSDEQLKAAWSEVLNQYQRRADLVPNLVNTVKGFAQQEKQVFMQVTEARSRVGSIQATPELVDDPEAFAKFQAAQRELGGALSRLLVSPSPIRSSSRTRISATCRRSSKAPRTASRWRATATSGRCRSTT